MPDIGDIYRVIAKGTLMSVVQTRAMHTYSLTSANATETEVAVALEDKVTSLYDGLKTLLFNQFRVYEVVTEKWHPAAGGLPGYWQQYHSQTKNVVGLAGGDISGYQPAMLLVLKTAAKRVLGRKFIPGLPEAETALGVLSAQMLTALGTFITSMLQSVVFGAGGVAVPGVKDKNDSFAPFISGTAGSIISSMRRRKPGYGI